jgi:predicted porin
MRQNSITKSTLAVLAIFGAVGAHAEGSVTPYITIDAGIQALSKDKTGNSQTTFQDSPATSNRLGVKGEVDIAPSWKATTQLEGRYYLNGNGAPAQYTSTGNAVPRLFDRGANVGLDGPIGNFKLGLINNPVVGAHVDGDIRPAANSGGGIFAWFRNRPIDSSCIDGTCDFTFLQHAVSWQSKKIGDFSGTAHYVLGTGNRDAATTGSENNGGWGLTGKYDLKPFAANLGFQEMKDQKGYTVGRVNVLNGIWTEGKFTAKVGTTQFHQIAGGTLYNLNSSIGVVTPTTTTSVDQTNRLNNFGLSMQVTPEWKLSIANYAYKRQGDSSQNIDMNTIAADYQFNKWATAYGIFTSVKNGSAANQSAGYYSLSTVNGASNHAITIGIRSSFDGVFKF